MTVWLYVKKFHNLLTKYLLYQLVPIRYLDRWLFYFQFFFSAFYFLFCCNVKQCDGFKAIMAICDRCNVNADGDNGDLPSRVYLTSEIFAYNR